MKNETCLQNTLTYTYANENMIQINIYNNFVE